MSKCIDPENPDYQPQLPEETIGRPPLYTPDGPPVTPQEPEVIPTPAPALPEPTEQAPPAAEQAIPTVDAPATDIGTPTMSLISYLESTEAQVSTTQPTGELAPVPDALSSWLIAGGFIVAGLIMVANDWLKARK